jgi:hypothetical protein
MEKLPPQLLPLSRRGGTSESPAALCLPKLKLRLRTSCAKLSRSFRRLVAAAAADPKPLLLLLLLGLLLPFTGAAAAAAGAAGAAGGFAAALELELPSDRVPKERSPLRLLPGTGGDATGGSECPAVPLLPCLLRTLTSPVLAAATAGERAAALGMARDAAAAAVLLESAAGSISPTAAAPRMM